MKKFGIQNANVKINEKNGHKIAENVTTVIAKPNENLNNKTPIRGSVDNGVIKSHDRSMVPRPRVIRRRSFNEENRYRNWCERTLDVFEMIGKIGEGSYGMVYKAKDKHTGMKM